MSEISEDLITQKWLLQACRDFKLPVTSASDNFFSIGGTSITLMRLVSRAAQELGVTLEPEEVLEADNIGDVAALLSNKQSSARSTISD
jgi:acyl carrier protein